MKSSLKKFVVSSLFVAMAFVLSFVKLFRMPLGGSVTFLSMLVISLPAYFYGVRLGFASSFAYSILQLIQGGYVINPFQMILDYILAFTCFGVVAFFREKKHGLYIGFFVACTIRLLSSSLSGYIFFREYAPEAWNPVIYTIAYNAGYIYVEYLISVVVLSFPQVRKLIDEGRIRM